MSTAELRHRRVQPDIVDPTMVLARAAAASAEAEQKLLSLFTGGGIGLNELIMRSLSSAPTTLRRLRRLEERGLVEAVVGGRWRLIVDDRHVVDQDG
jgi:hypothetical protein